MDNNIIATKTIEEREKELTARETELHDWAGEIQERERLLAAEKRRAAERERVNQMDYLFDAICRDNNKRVVIEPVNPHTSAQPRLDNSDPSTQTDDQFVQYTWSIAAIMSIVALLAILVAIAFAVR